LIAKPNVAGMIICIGYPTWLPGAIKASDWLKFFMIFFPDTTWRMELKIKFALIWFSGFRGEDLNVIFYQNMPICIIGINRLKEKFHRKTWNIC
jgi:hypothetical protein